MRDEGLDTAQRRRVRQQVIAIEHIAQQVWEEQRKTKEASTKDAGKPPPIRRPPPVRRPRRGRT